MPKELPLRVGVFDRIAAADEAVRRLVDGGVDREKIAVVCSDHAVREHYPDVETPSPSGERDPDFAWKGGAIGALLGGITAATVVTTGGVALLVAGAFFALAGAGIGTFAGAMAARGVQRELADLYDQALEEGRILVAVEGEGAELGMAERVFRSLGAKPLGVAEG